MPTDHHPATDPERGLELLWGDRRRPSRGPKPALSVETIARTGIEMADDTGLDALSLAQLAKRLGVANMSLYRYFPGKAELIAVMLDMATGVPPSLADTQGDWRAGLQRWATENLAVFRRHPWILQAATARRVMGPNELAWFEAALRTLSSTGFTAREMVDIVVMISGYVRGAAQGLASAAQARRDTGVTESQWAAHYAQIMRRVVDEQRYPTLIGVLQAGALDEPADNGQTDRGFAFGLQRILDGIQTLHDARQHPTTSPRGAG